MRSAPLSQSREGKNNYVQVDLSFASGKGGDVAVLLTQPAGDLTFFYAGSNPG